MGVTVVQAYCSVGSVFPTATRKVTTRKKMPFPNLDGNGHKSEFRA